MTDRHPLLWVDMKVSRPELGVTDPFEELFEVCHYSSISSLDAEIKRTRPRIICFDFDFPTKPGLKSLQQTKFNHSSIPILMLTVQHSEALAVWAFRARVWDYLVKPIAKTELQHCLVGLREMLQLQTMQPQSRTPAVIRSHLPDENRINGPRGNAPLALAPAIEYVEQNFRSKLSSSSAARKCGLTAFQFSRVFKETYGLTFQDYVLRFRIREACRLLKNPAAEISDVAFLVGFNDPSYFGKIFRRYMRCSPSEFHADSKQTEVTDLLLADLALESAGSEARRN